jgi:enediyne polyketide synthase
MSGRIAIVGMACRYPDAKDPAQLWENVLAGRRAFRRIPDERMRLDDYWSEDPAEPDRFYSPNAAVIEGFEFDRAEFKVPGSTYRVTDLTHWLALDTAARALADAGFPGGDGLPRRSTAVVVGNTLTGEFTRANLMRLRWPYVRRVVGAALQDHGWDDADVAGFLRDLEPRYKRPFPPVNEDTLVGGLSNTIAGRICNHFDFKGGGFTVDGACASSLLAAAQACNALRSGEADAAIVGGVDLSIDPFEVIGFAKTGALATGEMRVYDRHSNGFWPGEGCGMVVLVRDEDAQAQGLRRYAAIAGWGISSDGRGGITRPEAEGHRLAVERAYKVAGFDISSVSYLEGHGTGTAVGDATELRALGQSRRDAGATADPAAISTIKGNIGHTKAAAGVAGLIKATLAVHHQVIPPATGHHEPHPELTGSRPALRVPRTAELWPAGQPVRAGVSAMGFGGINAHLVVESGGGARREQLDRRTVQLVSGRQDAELVLLDADSTAELRDRVATLAGPAGRLSYAEVGDLAAMAEQELAGRPVRCAVVAASPDQLVTRLRGLLALLDSGRSRVIDAAAGTFFDSGAVNGGVLGSGALGGGATQPRIGFLFPGQGSGRQAGRGAIAARFDSARALYETVSIRTDGDLADTSAAQPRIVAASAAGLRVLSALGIEAVAAAGHSLGELTSLHWAGAMDEAELVRLAAARGATMAAFGDGNGAMAGIAAGPKDVAPLLRGEPVVIAGYNGPRQTVVSGPATAVERICARATAGGLGIARIAVSHAFHSPAMARAATEFASQLRGQRFRQLERTVLSTVTGDPLPGDTDIADLLVRQVLEPVRFGVAVSKLAADTDLLLEVGPGRVLTALAADIAPTVPVIALDTDSGSLAGTMSAIAAAFVLGAPVRHDQLFSGRLARPLPPQLAFRFLANPCELAPQDQAAQFAFAGESERPEPSAPPTTSFAAAGAGSEEAASGSATPEDERSVDLLRRLMAHRAELPLDAIRADTQPLDELHLSSITVGQIVNQAARELGVSAPLATASVATASVADLAQMLDDMTSTALPADGAEGEPTGVAPWVRGFTTELVPEPPGRRAGPGTAGEWRAFASAGHPLAEPLVAALRAAMLGDGVLLCLPADCDERHVGLMLNAARAALADGRPCRFVVVADRLGAAGLAKTLHLEAPSIVTTAVTMPIPGQPAAHEIEEIADRVVADVAATAVFTEVHYDSTGTRRVPVLRPLPAAGDAAGLPIGSGDVLLVTGGGKGITAECALALAKQTGAAIGLLGRSDPATDADLAANLDRMAAADVTHCYIRADVTSHVEVKAAVGRITAALGPVTAVLHGAGRNEPAPLSQLDEDSFMKTLAPKITGLDAVLAAVDVSALRLLITFGSIIGRAGLRGQADYAVANDWLTELTSRIQEAHPHCRCLALEWSVWAGAGMGERLGVLESLIREGISPISVEDGVAALSALLARSDLPTAIVVMGRVGNMPTISLERRELPLARFTEQPRVYYPDIELVADAQLSVDSDPYLLEHELDGELLFPAVFGMEAMAQAAAVLLAADAGLVLENVEFLRPIVVPAGGSATIRIAALNRSGSVDVVIRSSDTNFQADHFRATLRCATSEPIQSGPQVATTRLPNIPLDPGHDLYGGIFFQGKRFQRVRAYKIMSARSCVAEVSAERADGWFGTFLPARLLLGDPGTRDAFMHAIQVCVPDATLLPSGAERIYLGMPHVAGSSVVLTAVERHHDGDTYTYDLDVRGPGGELIESWEGLRLQAVRKQDQRRPWAAPLLGPFLERHLAAEHGSALRLTVEPDGAAGPRRQRARRNQTALAARRMFGETFAVRYRRDGKPEVTGGVSISASHNAGVTLVAATTAGQVVGCDVQLDADQAVADWELLLSQEQLKLARAVALEGYEELSVGATRVWGAIECLRKVGYATAGPITLARCGPDGWVEFRAGAARVSSFSAQLRGETSPVIFTILTEGGD